METSQHVSALQREGERMAAAAGRAGLGAAVPSCPGWQVRDLLRHTGYVHRWAARIITERLAEPPDETEAAVLAGGPGDAELLGWFRDGHAGLVAALEAADPGAEFWRVVAGASAVAVWARRQAHETAIHRADAELAAGVGVTAFPAEFAADGIDELIMGLFGRDVARLSAGQRAGPRQVVQVVAEDGADGGGTGGGGAAGRAWLVELTGDGTLAARVARGGGASGCTLAGPASGVYLVLWNRLAPAAAGVAVTGDEVIASAWRGGMRVTWA